MAVSELVIDEDERLPLILGFQKVADATNQLTRFVEYGKGIKVFDTDGREYIEATSSFYVTALGYQNDELIDAIEKQYRELPFFVSALNRTSKSSLDLAERLVDILPVDNAHILFASTGSEAIDFLIKMLRFGAVARGVPRPRVARLRPALQHGGGHPGLGEGRRPAAADLLSSLLSYERGGDTQQSLQTATTRAPSLGATRSPTA